MFYVFIARSANIEPVMGRSCLSVCPSFRISHIRNFWSHFDGIYFWGVYAKRSWANLTSFLIGETEN